MAFFVTYLQLSPSEYRKLTLLEREALLMAFKERYKK